MLAFALDAHAAGEDQAIAKLVQAVSHAMVELPKTKTVKHVLQYFSPDYTFVEDGEFKTMKDLEGLLQSFAAEKPAEELIGIKDEVVNLKVHIVGDWAWATYDETFTATLKGELIDEDISKCTGIFRKTKGRWLYVHEHCSEGQEDASGLVNPTSP
jgi:ketosteroid isomerase-like protein